MLEDRQSAFGIERRFATLEAALAWGDFDAVKKGFRDFVENIPLYGFAAVCTDHPEVQAMAARVENRRLVTYGTNPQAEVRATHITMGPDGAKFDVQISPRDGGSRRRLMRFSSASVEKRWVSMTWSW